MATKLYFHRSTTSDTGTLPAAGTSVTGRAPVQIASGGDTNRSMDTTISVVAQTSQVLNTLGNTSAQDSLIARFLSAPLAAQTIASQTIAWAFAHAHSNANSAFTITSDITVWRPSTGAAVGQIFPTSFNATGGFLAGSTSEVWSTHNLLTDSIAVLDEDIIVFEVWRNTTVQVMGTVYTNTYWYDGTTEGSSTDAASFVNFPNTLTFFTPAAPSLVLQHGFVNFSDPGVL